jgi:acetyltransferase-like isoleucine patch superfamily enzyme
MRKRIAFEAYSYLEHLLWALCAILPPFLRKAVFRLAFKHFGEGCIIDYGVYVRYPWKVSIGQGSILNRGCRLYPSYAVRDAEIIIGKQVAIGPDVVLCSAGHDHASLALTDTAETIRIHDHVWIGARSVILPGVEIGEGTVVGAGSVVTHSLPAWCVAVGNPARANKERKIMR